MKIGINYNTIARTTIEHINKSKKLSVQEYY